jgi:tRNA A-37 threonylcarbamoyl transferase component Bud32
VNEGRVYDYLEDIQGVAIPTLHYWGDLYGGMRLAVITSDEGDSLPEEEPEERTEWRVVSSLAKANAFAALNIIHDAGVLHGDVRGANIAIREDSAKLIDFGMAKIVGRKVDEENKSKEVEDLKKAFAFVKIDIFFCSCWRQLSQIY